ncbi:hypothetical protein ZIOFF_004302 [Zingiber officinale]|uniref:cellulase n=1 Tax=Zingiber officinale TaxID=94328 RepID=A0A8J5IQN4_ZINOF|nr:hypothetical protein ZIOFF_004302 [Zingiber officinale]
MTSLINRTGSLLSWSVIEYSAKYESTKELHHIKEIIRWGVDYLLKTFNSSVDTTNNIVAEVEQGLASRGSKLNNHYSWMRPEDIDYQCWLPSVWARCSDLAAEVAAALAVASIVFKNDKVNSYKLVHGVFTLWKFASRDIKHKNVYVGQWDAASFNSTSLVDSLK